MNFKTGHKKMDTTKTQFKVSFHYKDEWTDASTNKLISSEYCTETQYANSQAEIDALIADEYDTNSMAEYDGVVYKRELIGHDTFDVNSRSTLTKEEMFDFILNNWVSISPDGGIWTKTDGTKVRVKYRVSINDALMCGMDLEEAIQYYYNNNIRKE